MPIETPFVEDLPIRAKDVQTLKEHVYHQHALPAREVDMMIDQRKQNFIEEAKALGLIEVEEVSEFTPGSMRQPLESPKAQTIEVDGADRQKK